MGATIDISALPLVILFMGLISMAFVGLGVAIGSVLEDMHGFQLIMNFLVMPMFFLSGALFPLGNAPEIVRMISYIDPLTYAVEAMRFLLIGQSTMPIELSAGVMVVFFAITTAAATYLFNRIES
jgi:ABC-2 type transport system permease protein